MISAEDWGRSVGFTGPSSFGFAQAIGHHGLTSNADGWLPGAEHTAQFLSLVVNAIRPYEASAGLTAPGDRKYGS